ncbi:hypothetical protein BGW41_001305 [Actinomortierella wolfii]|nr:hypothetical protein BGW41_001305 [Actinomortierella wolfii]
MRLFYVNVYTGHRTWDHPNGPTYQALDVAAFQDRLRNYQEQLARYNQMYGRGGYGNMPPMRQQYGYDNRINNGFSHGGRLGHGGLGKGLMGFLGGSLIGGGIGHAIGSHPASSYDNNYNNPGGSFFDNNQGYNGGTPDFSGGSDLRSEVDFINNGGSRVDNSFDHIGGGNSFLDDLGNEGGYGGGGSSSFFDQGGGNDLFGGGDHVGSGGGGGESFFNQDNL